MIEKLCMKQKLNTHSSMIQRPQQGTKNLKRILFGSALSLVESSLVDKKKDPDPGTGTGIILTCKNSLQWRHIKTGFVDPDPQSH
jgi:hypothetical protein